jgi:hypothetical protein
VTVMMVMITFRNKKINAALQKRSQIFPGDSSSASSSRYPSCPTTKRYAKVLFFDVRRVGNLTVKTREEGEFFVCCFEVVSKV